MSVRHLAYIALLLSSSLFGCVEQADVSGNGNASGRGAAYYASVCAKCHGANGEGVGKSFPPLARSEWVTGDEERLIKIVLYGLQGPIEVRGETYRGLMVGFERQLGDEQIAEILTYVRSSWGNSAAAVEPSTVMRIREMPNPGRPIRAEELAQP